MDNLIFSVNAVLPIFLIMCFGLFLSYIKIFDSEFLTKANNFVFKVLSSIMLFNNIYKSDLSKDINIKLIIFSVSSVIILIAILLLLIPKLEKDRKNIGVIIQGLYRSNFMFLGIQLANNIFGEKGVVAVSALVAIIVPFYNFVSVVILDMYSSDKKDLKKVFVSIIKNPLIIASILGIIVSLIGFKLPKALEISISDISKTATPLALLFLGGDIKIKRIKNNLKRVVLVSIGKLIVIPSIVVYFAILFGFRGAELGAIFSLIAPSVAVSSYTMAQQYDCNYELAGQIVFVTTMLSSVSIFMFVFSLKSLGYF